MVEFAKPFSLWDDRRYHATLRDAALLDLLLLQYLHSDRPSKQGVAQMTPAEITKLTDQANRAKALMARSSKVSDTATQTLSHYEKTLDAFESHVNRVSKEDAALSATLAALGNAAPVLDEAFKPDPVGAKPGDTAHLNKVEGK